MVQSEIEDFTWPSRRVGRKFGKANSYWLPLGLPQYIHTIDADARDIMAVLDGLLWEHIIGNDRCVPPKVRERMRLSCCSEARDRHAALKRLEDDYIRSNLPANPWDCVIASDVDCRMAQILLGWPLNHSRIIDVKTIIREPAPPYPEGAGLPGAMAVGRGRSRPRGRASPSEAGAGLLPDRKG